MKLLDFFKGLFKRKPKTRLIKNMNRAERRRMQKAVAKVYCKNLRQAPGVPQVRNIRRATAKAMAKVHVEKERLLQEKPSKFSWKRFFKSFLYRLKWGFKKYPQLA